MSNSVIPLAGGIIGSFFGPYGFAIGWSIGSAYQTSQSEVRVGPDVGDLRVQTSQYGVHIPIIFGKQRMSGNVIWAQEKKTYDIKEQGGKGGPTLVSTGYTVSMAIGICKGDVKGISRVWADGKLLIDSTTDVKPLVGQLYTGSDTQVADPTIESIEGAGNVPAYRGLAYIVLTDFDLGVSGRIPNFSFEIIKEV